MLIGLFVVVAVGLIVGLILFIEPSVGDGKQVVHIRFSNLQGINIGTRVNLAGKTIGEVAEIQIVPQAREKVVGTSGQVYLYLVTCRIDSSVILYKTDEFTVGTSGLMGEKYILIVPKELPPHTKKQRLTAKDVAYADSSDMLETALNELANVSDKIGETLDTIMDWMHKYGDNVGSAVKSIDQTVKDIGLAVTRFNDLDIIGDVKGAIGSATRTIDNIDDIIVGMDKRGTFVYASNMIRNLDQITLDITEKKGTLGRLISDDNLYLQVNALLCSANTLMSDINNYGLMFNTDRDWKRKRLQQAHLANAVKNPRDFQAYMDREMSDVKATLGRMDLAVQKLHTMHDRTVLSDQTYQKELADLMRQLDSLIELVELYNKELVDQVCN
ncbi:MAG: hypothetical protein S4CHLAM102_03630 [Chlamydiia bacterium]|nr:hypothetical protein [Chlamydiia bacterium]